MDRLADHLIEEGQAVRPTAVRAAWGLHTAVPHLPPQAPAISLTRVMYSPPPSKEWLRHKR